MISFFQGNSVDMTVSVFRGDNSQPFDITNNEVWFTIKESFSDPDSAALLQVTTTTGITFLNASEGVAIISLTPDQTKTLPTDQQLHFDVQIRTPAGKVYTVYLDTLVVNDKVTDTLNY